MFSERKRFVHDELGWNFRMTNIQAAIGLAQIERFEEFVLKKQRMGKRYSALLKNLEYVQLPLEQTEYSDNIFWVYGLVLKENTPYKTEIIMKKLKNLVLALDHFFGQSIYNPL